MDGRIQPKPIRGAGAPLSGLLYRASSVPVHRAPGHFADFAGNLSFRWQY